jgi:hypothetical protein
VSRTAALLSLPGPVQAALSASRLSRSQAEELLALGRWPSNQESLAVECEAQGWTAADLAVAVKRRKEYLEAKERPAAPAVVPGDPESERAARERNLAVAIASPPPVEQPAVTPAPPPAAKPGALKSAEEIARERQAARTGEPAPPAPITAIIPGPLRQRFEALGGFAIPALTLWCELAELATEHEITPQLAVRLLGRFLAYCTGLALRPETVISELEENLRKLEAEDSDG